MVLVHMSVSQGNVVLISYVRVYYIQTLTSSMHLSV